MRIHKCKSSSAPRWFFFKEIHYLLFLLHYLSIKRRKVANIEDFSKKKSFLGQIPETMLVSGRYSVACALTVGGTSAP